MSSCQVCREAAIGFYCGANVCEACKKFFVRCLKMDLVRTFKCSGDGRCPVNRWTRTKCPYCRMKRCLDLNMYAPGNQSSVEDLGNLPCQVCGAPSSGFHFGAYTCEGCKGFFRKCLLEENFVIPRCQRQSTEGRKCHITAETRNDCKFCRFEKCLRVGMDLKKVRIGRQSNLIKHKTNQFLEKLKSRNECIQIDANISSKLAKLLNSEKKNIFRPHLPHKRRNEATSTATATTISAQAFASPSADDDEDDDPEVHSKDIIKVSQDVIPASGRRNYVSLNRGRSKGHVTTSTLTTTAATTSTNTTFQLARYSSNKSHLTTNPSITYGLNSQCPLSLLDEEIPGMRVRDCDFNIWLDLVSTKQRDIIHYVTESFDFLDRMFDQGCPIVAVHELSTESLFEIFVNCLLKAVPAIFSFAARISEVLPSICMPEVVEELEKNRCLLSPKIFFAVICFLSAQKYDSERDLVNFMGMNQAIMSVLLKRFHSMKAVLPTFRKIGKSTAPLSLDKTELSFLCSIFVMDMYNMSACKSILIDLLESYESFNHRDPSRFVMVLSTLRIFFLLVELRKLAISSITSESNAGSFALPIPTTYQNMFSEPAWSL